MDAAAAAERIMQAKLLRPAQRGRANSRAGRADDAGRAADLLLAAVHRWEESRDKLDCNDGFIARWNRLEGLAALLSPQAG